MATRARRVEDVVPPREDEAERTVLGQMMSWPDPCIEIALTVIDPDDFYHPGHQRLCGAILAADEETGGQFDLGVLHRQLQRDGSLEEIGGKQYLIDLVEDVATSETTKHYARLIRDASVIRRLCLLATETLSSTFALFGAVWPGLCQQKGAFLTIQ